MNDPSVPTPPEIPVPPATEATQSPSTAVDTGIVIYPTDRLEIGSTLYSAVQMGGRIDFEIKQTIHVPRARILIVQGMELLATAQGLLFRQLCDHWHYIPEDFYNAIEKYATEQEKLRIKQNKQN